MPGAEAEDRVVIPEIQPRIGGLVVQTPPGHGRVARIVLGDFGGFRSEAAPAGKAAKDGPVVTAGSITRRGEQGVPPAESRPAADARKPELRHRVRRPVAQGGAETDAVAIERDGVEQSHRVRSLGGSHLLEPHADGIAPGLDRSRPLPGALNVIAEVIGQRKAEAEIRSQSFFADQLRTVPLHLERGDGAGCRVQRDGEMLVLESRPGAGRGRRRGPRGQQEGAPAVIHAVVHSPLSFRFTAQMPGPG